MLKVTPINTIHPISQVHHLYFIRIVNHKQCLFYLFYTSPLTIWVPLQESLEDI
jgi:hypothetical protein